MHSKADETFLIVETCNFELFLLQVVKFDCFNFLYQYRNCFVCCGLNSRAASIFAGLKPNYSMPFFKFGEKRKNSFRLFITAFISLRMNNGYF